VFSGAGEVGVGSGSSGIVLLYSIFFYCSGGGGFDYLGANRVVGGGGVYF